MIVILIDSPRFKSFVPWQPYKSIFFMETGLCNSIGHKKIAKYLREVILILDPVQRQDKTLHNSYVCINMIICINTDNSRNYLGRQETRVKSQAI